MKSLVLINFKKANFVQRNIKNIKYTLFYVKIKNE